MRDRLIELLDGADLFLRNRANAEPAPLNEYDIEAMLDIAKVCDEAARTLEKSVVPPCKVGEVVWGRDVEPQKVISIEYFSRKVIHLHCVSPVTGIRHTFAVGKRSLGKTVFLTREEAERALKGGADNGKVY